MSKRNNIIWKGIQVICWLILIGYCIQTGALLFNFIFSLFRPIATHNLHIGLNLSELYNQSKVIYSFVFAVIIVISGLKAYLFFVVLKLFKALNHTKLFSEDVSAIIYTITSYTFAIGLVSVIAHQIAKKLSVRGYNLDVIERYWNDGSGYLVLSAILFLIALIFQKGIELQNENDLTV